jgi:uncharacterized protein (DUF362 family)
LEPTCLALLALSRDTARFRPTLDAGLSFLRGCRQADGSYRLPRGREAAVWGTAQVLLALTRLGDLSDADAAATAGYLLGLKGRVIAADPEVADMVDIDMGLTGWPWAEGNFSWVEPTAWACLALTLCGHGDHPRIQEGLRLLRDRAFDTGGANYGNKFILGRTTEPIPGPSALLLLALQKQPDEPRVRATVDYLKQQLAGTTDLEHLGWGKLALDLHLHGEERTFLGDLDSHIRAGSEERPTRGWTRPAPLRLALAALALGCGDRNPLRLGDVPAVSPVLAGNGSPRKPRLGERVKSVFRGVLVRGLDNLRQPPTKSEVHVAPVADYNADLADVLGRQFAHFREQVPLAGKRVVLKPNLVEYHRDKVINTDPRVVAAIIELCRQEGAAEVIVAEGPGHWRNLEYLVSASGLGDVLKHYQVPLVDLNHDEPVKTLNLGRLTGLEYLYLTRTITSADVFISLPKLKTHHWAGATLSLKNLFGTLPGVCYGWPKNELHWRGIAQSIIDIALTQTPHLAIVDAIVGMEGDGPLNGTAKPLGALVMGTDLVAVDATCCRLMGMPAERIAHLALGAHKRLGRLAEEEVVQLGERIDTLATPFAPPPRFDKLLLAKSG